MGLTSSYLDLIGESLYLSLDKLTGVEWIKINGIETLLTILALKNIGNKKEITKNNFKILISTVLIFGLLSIANNGRIEILSLQIRPLLTLALIAKVISETNTRDHEDPYKAIILIKLICAIRCVTGIFIWYFNLRLNQDFSNNIGGGSYVLTHSDSVLCATTVAITASQIVTTKNRQKTIQHIIIISLVLVFTSINNRRIVFIEIAFAVISILYFAKDKHIERIKIAAKKISSFVILYSAIFWKSEGITSKPINAIMSTIDRSDSSSITRDIENYNLIQTIKLNPITGTGLASEYIEKIKANDISKIFESYLFVPHNSFLWLYSSMGILGSSAFLFSITRNLQDSRIILKETNDPNEESLIYSMVGATAAYIIQSFGDMGIQSQLSAVIMGTLSGYALKSKPSENRTENDIE